MAYSKQTWDTTSYVNPTRMNHIEDGIEAVDGKTKLTSLVNLSVNLTTNYFIIAGITNEQNQDGIHVYISTSSSSAKKIIVYKRENGTTTELYSLS